MTAWWTAACVLVLAASGADEGASADDTLTIVFNNGDRARAHVRQISGGRVRFALAVAPDQPLNAPLERVERLTTERSIQSGSKHARLSLRTGTELLGALTGFEDGALVFDSVALGEVKVPMKLLSSYETADAKPLPPDTDFSKHIVQTDSGDVLVGEPHPAGSGSLGVRGEGATLTVASEHIAAVYMPATSASTRPAKGADEERYELVRLRSGEVVAGRGLSVVEGQLALKLPGMGEVTSGMGGVAAVDWMKGAMAAGRSHLRRVLVWGGWADRDEELVRTIRALEGHLPGWTIQKDVSRSFDAEFRRRLDRCRALVIAEQEQWGSEGREKLAQRLEPIVRRFVQGGGNVVLLGMLEREQNFCRQTGLIDYRKIASGDGVSLDFTEAGKRLAGDVGESFTSTNSTMRYEIGDTIGAEIWAQPAGNRGAAILGRRAGRGWIVLMGMDFYEDNEQTRQILANAVKLR